VSAIAQQLDIDRKTVRKYLLEPPLPYQRQHPASSKLDPFRNILRERWEQGVRMNCGWGCGTQLTVSQMQAHFADCLERPRA
jgi:hypothetical protein